MSILLELLNLFNGIGIATNTRLPLRDLMVEVGCSLGEPEPDRSSRGTHLRQRCALSEETPLAIPDAPLSSIHAFRGEPFGCRALFAPGTKEAADAGVEGAEKPAAIDYSRHSSAWLGNRPERECIAKSRLHQAALNYERTTEVVFL
jgi:hypothetical protein